MKHQKPFCVYSVKVILPEGDGRVYNKNVLDENCAGREE
jgi:hypothetical protein